MGQIFWINPTFKAQKILQMKQTTDQIQTFKHTTDLHEIQNYFNSEKKPFVIKNAFSSSIDLNYLEKHFSNQDVIALNENSDKEILPMSELINKVNQGKKYRLRANTKIGNQLKEHIDTHYLEQVRGNKKHLFDYLLSFGKTSRQNTLFLSTSENTFSKHAHVISGLIIHLYGHKTWYISKSRERFQSIKYKSLLNPNPLYVTDKDPTKEIALKLEPGDMLYMPAYWFHYTYSYDINISYSHFFTEPIQYYLYKTFLMFTYQAVTNPVHSFIKAIRKEPEEHIFDREEIIDKCNKIRNKAQRDEALQFFKDNDYS